MLQKLLDDLKNWKMGDLEGVANLQHIVQQQQDLIRSIEDQLDRLRQLLLLREQFIALIADITMFITRYTEVIKDIETGGHSTQEKIKKYDDVSSVHCYKSVTKREYDKFIWLKAIMKYLSKSDCVFDGWSINVLLLF